MRLNFRTWWVACVAFSVFIISLTARAANDEDLIAKGESIFTQTTQIGAKFNCILCHGANKAIRRSEVERLGDQLPDVINKYLTEKCKAKPLAKEGEEMKALAAYIRTKHSV